MSKILVTGGCGFIGSNLVDKLIEMSPDNEVYVIDNLSSGKKENLHPKAKFILADINDRLEDFDTLPKGIEYIFHLAAIPRVPYSVKNPVETHKTNVDGTLNVLEYARKINAKKVVFASSSSVYGDQRLPLKETMKTKPKSPYALHKAIGEEYMRLYDELYGLPTLSLRFFNVYGPKCDPDSEYSLVIGKFLKQKKEGKRLTIFGDGEQTRDFTHVFDIVDGLVAGMSKPVHNKIINLCNGHNVSINKIAELIGGFGEEIKEYLPPREGDVLHTLGDNKKATKFLGWISKISIEEGLRLMGDK